MAARAKPRSRTAARTAGLTVFAGSDQAAKLRAADAMADKLGVGVYRVDLSRVVGRYIGETEKNLNRIFDKAARSGDVLFFDEADALFGKRSEVKDAHDRYVNVELGDFLGRVAALPAPVIVSVGETRDLSKALTRRAGRPVRFPPRSRSG